MYPDPVLTLKDHELVSEFTLHLTRRGDTRYPSSDNDDRVVKIGKKIIAVFHIAALMRGKTFGIRGTRAFMSFFNARRSKGVET
jgi:hypothetical protein